MHSPLGFLYFFYLTGETKLYIWARLRLFSSMLWVLRACLICLLAYLHERQRRDEWDRDYHRGWMASFWQRWLYRPDFPIQTLFIYFNSLLVTGCTQWPCPATALGLLEVGWRRARQLYNKSTNTNARFLEAWNWHYTLGGSRSNPMKHWASNGFYAQSDMGYEASSSCEAIVTQKRKTESINYYQKRFGERFVPASIATCVIELDWWKK